MTAGGALQDMYDSKLAGRVAGSGLPRRRVTLGAAETPVSESHGSELAQNLGKIAKVTASALAPPTLLLALAVYFSVRRQEALALHFGIDVSVLDFSTQDYLLRAGDPLFIALLVVLTVGLVCLYAHSAVIRLLKDPTATSTFTVVANAFLIGGAAIFVIGVIAVFRPVPLPIYARTLSLGLGIGMVAYGRYLRNHLDRRHRDEPPWVTAASIATVVALIFLSAFWTTKELAQALGRGQAEVLEATLQTRPGVVVLSARRLGIEGPGVTEEVLDDDTAAYAFQYSGLRLLVRSGGQFFLLPSEWTREDGNAIALRELEGLRVEFTPGGRTG